MVEALARAAFYLLLFGALVAITATGHITLGLTFHITVSWSLLIAWQALAGGVIILPARNRRVSLSRAFELLFLAYVPWSLYGLAMTALAVLAEPDLSALVVAVTAVAPIAWTSVLIAGFCRTVLGKTAAGARRLTLVHQFVDLGRHACLRVVCCWRLDAHSSGGGAVSLARTLSAACVVAGLLAGTWSESIADPAARRSPAGEWILAADFHVHAFPGDGGLPPWALRHEAARAGLDVFTISNHNRVSTARLARWMSQRSPGPIVIVGQEVTARGFHVIAAGIEERVSWRTSAADVIRAVHAQGGVASPRIPSGDSGPRGTTRLSRLLTGTSARIR